ncbi:MAG: Holliday junction branch migration protein RuvA [Deltaproteobacteria bacterium]|jgi:Holliday junction DNA helicase RuvA|nr:Holliday junction branch migration protein RuvA [Deltaproteobacteria bacterium]
MLIRLRGKLLEKNYGKVVVETGGGLGLLLLTPLTTSLALPEVGTEVILQTRLIMREESMELFGFLTLEERESFDILISVSRIGPRLALTIISALGPKELGTALLNQDLHKLSSIKGIGAKTAERILVELKDKATRLISVADATGQGPEASGSPTAVHEATLALQSLGYTRVEAERTIKVALKKTGADQSVETLIREALKTLNT